MQGLHLQRNHSLNQGVSLASFNSEAAGVGIPGAEGIVDRVRRIETGLARMSGLFGLACWPKRERVYLVCLVHFVG
jgi:hypothetical protein